MPFKFKKNAEKYHGTEDLWYALNEGYINPDQMLADEAQIESLEQALELINDFLQQAELAGLIGEEQDEQ
jgi:hypothetical protein